MKILQFNLYQCGVGRVGSKKSKPISASPHGMGLKSCPIPAPPPLRGQENPRGAKRRGAGRNYHPYLQQVIVTIILNSKRELLKFRIFFLHVHLFIS